MRPLTTLFMLMSLDGKISTGSTDNFDFDKDLVNIEGIKEGLNQYYDLEKCTDLYSFNSARVLVKTGINSRSLENINKSVVSFVLIDNKQHLNRNGLTYLSNWLNSVIIVTTNKNYNTYELENVKLITYTNSIDFIDLFNRLYIDYGIERITIQSGSTLNSILFASNLIDNVNIIIAPCIIGGENTPTLVGGKDNLNLDTIHPLVLTECSVLENSYLSLKYTVKKNQK